MNYKEFEIIEERDNGTFVIACHFCKGSGLHPTDDWSDEYTGGTCEVCMGRGTHIIQARAEEMQNCAKCAGTGRDWDLNNYFVGDFCNVCNGIGIVMENSPIVPGDSQADNNFWIYLHPRVVDLARRKFNDGHYADCIESVLKDLNNQIKIIVRKNRSKEIDGASLMQYAFSLQNPVLRLADLNTDTGRSIQNGYMQIFSGAMTGIRNPKTHENINLNRTNTIHLLYFSSMLFRKLDEAKIV